MNNFTINYISHFIPPLSGFYPIIPLHFTMNGEKSQCFSFKRISNDMIVDRLNTVCKSEGIDIDEEVLAVINTCYNDAYRLLEENKDILDRISEYLYEKSAGQISYLSCGF